MASGDRRNLLDAVHAGIRDRQARAVEQRGPYLEGRRVERERRKLKERVVRADRDVVGVADEPRDAALFDRDPLRPAGRARGVHDVGERTAVAGRRRASLVGVCRQRGDRDDRTPQAGRGRVACDDQRDPGVVRHRGQAPGRIRLVERNVGRAGSQNAEQQGRQLERAFECDADRAARPDPPIKEVVRDPVGGPIELRIGQGLAAGPGNGDSRRPLLRPPGKCRIDRRVAVVHSHSLNGCGSGANTPSAPLLSAKLYRSPGSPRIP